MKFLPKLCRTKSKIKLQVQDNDDMICSWKSLKNENLLLWSDLQILWQLSAKYCEGYTYFSDVCCKLCCLNMVDNLLTLPHIPQIAVEGGKSCSTVHEKCKFLWFQTRKARCSDSAFFQHFRDKSCTWRQEMGLQSQDNDSGICA